MKGWNWKAWPKLFMASVATDGSIFGVVAGHGLGLARGARGVDDGQAEPAVGGLGRRSALHQRLVAREAGDVAADRDLQPNGPGARHLFDPAGEVGVQHEGRRLRVVHDALDLGPGQRRVEGDGLVPPLVGGQLPVQHVDVIRQGVGEDVAAQRPWPQGMDQLMGAPRQLREGQRDARGAGDDGRQVRMFFGDVPEAEPLVPGVPHRE